MAHFPLAKRRAFLYKVFRRAEVAQLVEQGTENPRVGSSILSLGTTFNVEKTPRNVVLGRFFMLNVLRRAESSKRPKFVRAMNLESAAFVHAGMLSPQRECMRRPSSGLSGSRNSEINQPISTGGTTVGFLSAQQKNFSTTRQALRKSLPKRERQ